MEGYVKLFRNLESWEWYDDANTMRVFLDILIHANFKPSRYRGDEIGIGDCVIGRKKIAKRLNISEQSVRTAINHLISTNEITIKSTNKYSVVSVVNWEKWQVYEGESNQQNNHHSNHQLTNNQPTTNQQLTTSEERKKERIKERKNYYSSEDEQEIFDTYNDYLSKRGQR